MKKIITNLSKNAGMLTTRCTPINTFDSSREAKKIIDQLMATANNIYGECLGLSANQIGYDKRIFVMRQGRGPFFHVINPVVVSMSGGVKRMNERCLSRLNPDGTLAEGKSLRRAKQIGVECFTCWDGDFRKETFHLSGMDARVFQHELDHLNGVDV